MTTKIDCPRAKSDMTPCYLRDGDIVIAYADKGWAASQRPLCVGCGVPIGMIEEEKKKSGGG